MARLHEYQGKALLARHGIVVPRGRVAGSAEEAGRIAREVGGRVVVKMQAWTTNRKALGGVAFAGSAEEAAGHAERMLGMKVGNFPVVQVLVEEMLAIKHELFVSVFIDDKSRGPAMLVSLAGGSGIEERAHASGGGGGGGVRRFECDVKSGPKEAEVRAFLAGSALPREVHEPLVAAVRSVFGAARANEARSLEINPLVVTADAHPRVVAADCRVTIDDYAVFRHPELGIEIARELDHPPTELERIAYAAEQADHRGTFYFAQMNTVALAGSRGLIGFHGAGGGGSMMSMDAITNEGFTIANFCDTSGNPSPAKVYRAARIILSQPGLCGYFGSGSGVASQEQYWSAYGLAKAFWEMELNIPAVIRLGGNTEDRAVEILETACTGLPGRVEGYRKTDPPAKIARRFAELVGEHLGGAEVSHRRGITALEDSPVVAPRSGAGVRVWRPRPPRRPSFVGTKSAACFPVNGGTLWIDTGVWNSRSAAIIARAAGLLKDDAGKPALTVKPDELMGKDSELIACEVECRRDGVGGLFVELEIPGLHPPPGDRGGGR
jgi:succinyl-CoA synthetase beta subunit